MQNDMVALRAVMRLGWEIPNPINAMVPDKTKRCPFAILTAGASGISTFSAGGADTSTQTGDDGVQILEKYTESQLSRLKIDDIKAVADAKGYIITKEVKADIIAEFLEQQNA